MNRFIVALQKIFDAVKFHLFHYSLFIISTWQLANSNQLKHCCIIKLLSLSESKTHVVKVAHI